MVILVACFNLATDPVAPLTGPVEVWKVVSWSLKGWASAGAEELLTHSPGRSKWKHPLMRAEEVARPLGVLGWLAQAWRINGTGKGFTFSGGGSDLE